MDWRRVFGSAGAAIMCLSTVGCGSSPSLAGASHASPTDPTPPSTSAPSTVEPIEIGYGVTLLPGDDGQLPVSVRWVQGLDAPEAFAVDGDVVYVADEVLWAFRLSDGAVRWETKAPDDEGLSADGGVVIGLDGPHRVRAWAPYNYDIVADRSSGRRLSFSLAGGDVVPAGMHVFRSPKPTQYRVNTSYPDRVVARRPDGTVAWRMAVDEPMISPAPAAAVPGGLAVMTGSGALVVLDYR